MLLLVGLGNPGPEYAKNRHNIGFMAVDCIADRYSFASYRKKFQGLLAEGDIAGEKVLALKPETFMNESGRSVAACASFYKVPPEDIIVLHDEIDLECAKVRVKRGGGHAGHNGLRSIHDHIGPDYARVRFGVGHPGEKDQVAGHVLKDFAKGDAGWLEKVLDAISGNADLLINGKDSDLMSKLADAVNPPRPSKPKRDAKKDEDDNDGL